MIEKFVSIKNVGRFRNCGARSDVALKKLTLIFAENGRGKTTLCAILRSLMSGRHEFISERKTLGSNHPASIQIRIAGNFASFSKDTWNTTHPEIAIFDSAFTHDNVYAGDYVDHEHKKNLYRVIVGTRGVQLAKQIEELDGKIRKSNSDLNLKKEVVSKTIPDGVSLDTYLAWQSVENIDTKIQLKSDEISKRQLASNKAAEIQTKGLLAKVSLPAFPSDFLTTLAKQLTDVVADAEARVRAQISKHKMGEQGETWLSEGLGYHAEDNCPFCGQDAKANELISAYRSHFNSAYTALKTEVALLGEQVVTAIGEPSLNAAQLSVSGNLTLTEFWKTFAAIDLPEFQFDEIRNKYAALRNLALALAQKKQQTPTDTVSPDDTFQVTFEAVQEFLNSVETYNAKVEACNTKINEQKTSAQKTGDIDRLKKELTDLETKKKRFAPLVVQWSQSYRDAVTEKAALEQQKETAKQQLDQYCQNILQLYEQSINNYLDQFNAGFRITNSRHQYKGGTPSSQYQILINNAAIDIGDARTQSGTPCFKSALSAGDRSALALAFFLAALRQDDTLANKIVVLDDPFTSLDRFRRECTAQLIVALANTAKQVIVLSHDPAFLKLVQDHAGVTPCKELQILKTGEGSVILEWSSEEETKGAYLKNYSILLSYYREPSGNLLQVAQAIRPFLEELYRAHFPGHFPANEWLGDFIGKVRDAENDEGLAHAKSDLGVLEAINQYSKKFHHGPMPDINSDELHSFVKRTLSLVGEHSA